MMCLGPSFLWDRTAYLPGDLLIYVKRIPTGTVIKRLRNDRDNKIPRISGVTASSRKGRIRNHPVLGSSSHCYRIKVNDGQSTAGSEHRQVGYCHWTRQ